MPGVFVHMMHIINYLQLFLGKEVSNSFFLMGFLCRLLRKEWYRGSFYPFKSRQSAAQMNSQFDLAQTLIALSGTEATPRILNLQPIL